MPYWGIKPDESDFASTSVSVAVSVLKQWMEKDIATVTGNDPHSEQAIIAHLACLRSIGEVFPTSFSVSFGKKDYLAAKQAFEDWYTRVHKKIPAKFRDGVLAEAQKEFALFEKRIFKGKL